MTYPPPFEPPAPPQPGIGGEAAFGPRHLTATARRSLVKWSIYLAIALVVVVFAGRSALHSTNATCAGHKMTKTDICVMDNGSRRSYHDQVGQERWAAWAFAGFGALVAVRSARELGRIVRRR